MRITGVPSGRLDHYLNAGLLTDIHSEGKGARRKYSIENLGQLIVADVVGREQNFTIHEIREVMTLFTPEDFVSIGEQKSDKALLIINRESATLKPISEIAGAIEPFIARHQHSGSKRAQPTEADPMKPVKIVVLNFILEG